MEIRFLNEFIPFGSRYLKDNPPVRPPSPSTFSHPRPKSTQQSRATITPLIANDIYSAPGPSIGSSVNQCSTVCGSVQLSPGYVVGEQPTHIYQSPISNILQRDTSSSKWLQDEGFDEELYVQGSEVIWSKAGQLVRSFSFYRERYPVSHALWIRALCVLLHDMAKFYLDNGHDYTVNMPVPVLYAWALDTGLLIQRRPDEGEQASESTRSAVLWTLLDPLTHFKPVSVRSTIQQQQQPPLSESINSNELYHQWMSLEHDICWISDHIERPWCMTRHRLTGQHQLWRYTCNFDDNFNQSELKRTISLISARRELNTVAPQQMASDTLLECLWQEPIDSTFINTLKQPKDHIINVQSQVFTGHHLNGDEVICILHTSIQKLYTYTVTVNGECVQLSKLFDTSALSATAICATRRHQRDILVVKPDYTLALWYGNGQPLICTLDSDIIQKSSSDTLDIDTTNHEPISKQPRQSQSKPSTPNTNHMSKVPIVRFQLPVYNRVNIVTSRHKTIRVLLDFTPRSPIVRHCWDAITYALPDTLYPMAYTRYMAHAYQSTSLATQLSDQQEWHKFCVVILSWYSLDTSTIDRNNDIKESDPWQWLRGSQIHRRHQTDPLIKRLNIPLSTIDTRITLMYQQALLLQKEMGSNTLPEKYRASLFYALHLIYEDLKLDMLLVEGRHRLGQLLVQIALLNRWTSYIDHYWRDGEVIPTRQLALNDKSVPFPVKSMEIPPCIFWTWSQRQLEHSKLQLQFPHPSMLSTMLKFTPLYQVHYDHCGQRTQQLMELHTELKKADPHSVISCMVKHGWTYQQLETLPINHYSQWHPNYNWPLSAYKLIGREDLITRTWTPQQWMDYHEQQYGDYNTHPNGANNTNSTGNGNTAIDDIYDGTNVNDNEITQSRFNADQRILEVQRLLQSAKIVKIRVPNTTDLSDHALSEQQLHHVHQLANRTLSRPVGRALLTYATVCEIDQGKPCLIPRLEVAAKIIGHRTIIRLDELQLAAPVREWPGFHNGVAASLRYSPSLSTSSTSTSTSTPTIDSSWIALNKPEQLTGQYGGFLYGLGLNGHLRELISWHSYSYLTAKHEIITLGLLIGLAASHCGTMNDQVGRILNLHIPAILPRGGADLLPTSYLPSGALLGMGLLYMETVHRRMTEVMLQEVGRVERSGCDEDDARQESYTLSAGFALGFITLGQGDKAQGLVDLNMAHVLAGSSHNSSHPLSMLSTHGAIVALGLLYLQTNNYAVAARLSIPTTPLILDQVRPDLLLLRTVCHYLILWHDIEPSLEWVRRCIPNYIHEEKDRLDRGKDTRHTIHQNEHFNNEDTTACIGLRFAGTADERASNVLQHYFTEFARLLNRSGVSFENRIFKCAVREGISVIAVAWSLIMAGSGDLTALKAIRQLQRRVSTDTHYGNHMANHMALGFLFLGAIALLLCATYPRWPSHPMDQRPHLQLLRHLWVMAVEPRCLVVREIESGEVCALPLDIEVTSTTSNKLSVTRMTTVNSPCLLPELNRVKRIRLNPSVVSHFPVELTPLSHPYQYDPFSQSWTLLVKRTTANSITRVLNESARIGYSSINNWLIPPPIDPQTDTSSTLMAEELSDEARQPLLNGHHELVKLQCLGRLNDMIIMVYHMIHNTISIDPVKLRDIQLAVHSLKSIEIEDTTIAQLYKIYTELLHHWIDHSIYSRIEANLVLFEPYYNDSTNNTAHRWPQAASLLRTSLIWLSLPSKEMFKAVNDISANKNEIDQVQWIRLSRVFPHLSYRALQLLSAYQAVQ
ncbi:hypothetical protein BDF19DRAFT_449242 [Syncephalis fuscata]|nr:hypothetical protein BDF19DRAFT_449242 [Syncephalis fuscata]